MNREGLRARRRQLTERIQELALCWSPTMDTCKALGLPHKFFPPSVQVITTLAEPSIMVINGNFTLMGAYRSWQTDVDRRYQLEGVDLLFPRRIDVFEAMGRYITQYMSAVAAAVLMLRLERDLEDAELHRDFDVSGMKTHHPSDWVLRVLLDNDPESAKQIAKTATMLGVDPYLREVDRRHIPAAYGPFFRMLGVLVLDDAMEFV